MLECKWRTTFRQLVQGTPIASLEVRVDGKVLASAGSTGRRRLWNAEKGTVIAELAGDTLTRRELARRDRAEKLASGDVNYLTSEIVEKAQAGQKAAADRLRLATDAKTAADAKATESQSAQTRPPLQRGVLEHPAATMPTTAPADPKEKQKIEQAGKVLTQVGSAAGRCIAFAEQRRHGVSPGHGCGCQIGRGSCYSTESLVAAQERQRSARDALAAANRDLVDRPVTHLAFSSDG